MKQINFIINPKAGNGYCLKMWKKVEEKLLEGNVPYFAFFTDYPGHAAKLANQIAARNNEHKVLIAVGGDGTMHQVMNGIVQYNNITLGYIPGGSGIDFARGFHIPSNPEDALEAILRLMKKRDAFIDIGKVTMKDNEVHYFINNLGAGFDAHIAYEVNQSKMKAILNKLSLGRLVYVFFLLKKLFTYKCSTLEISIDGKKHIFEKSWFVTISNQPFYGGGMKIAPIAVPDDGLLDITVVHQLSRVKLLFVFISVFWGKHIHFKKVKVFKGRTAAIQSSSPLYVHADGEIIGFTPLNIHVQTKTLKVLSSRQSKGESDLKERESNEFQ